MFDDNAEANSRGECVEGKASEAICRHTTRLRESECSAWKRVANARLMEMLEILVVIV